MRRFINKFTSKIEAAKLYKEVLGHIIQIRSRCDVINLCARPTGYAWLGVRNAGYSLFPKSTCELPQHYSTSLLSPKQLEGIADAIIAQGFTQVVFNGMPDGFDIIINRVKKKSPSTKVGIIHHGFWGELASNRPMQGRIRLLIELSQSKKIDKIAFAKAGMGKTFERLFKVPCYYIIYINPLPDQPPIFDVDKNIVKVGVLVNSTFRKNLHTQVAAALMLDASKVYVSEESDLAYFKDDRITSYGMLDHKAFLERLSQNTINMHVTFSEASGGQVFTESLAHGVPCLTGYTHEYLDDNDQLRNALVVDKIDDSWGIYRKAMELLEKREYIAEVSYNHSIQMNIKAAELLSEFLDG